MRGLQNIFRIAKKLVTSLVHSDALDTAEIESNFDEKNSKEIVERIQSVKNQGSRSTLVEKIDQEKGEDLKRIQSRINVNKRVYYIKTIQRVAAVFLLGLGGYYYYLNTESNNDQTKVAFTKAQNNEHIVLKLANGESQILTSGGNVEISEPEIGVIGSKSGKKLNYRTKHKTAFQELVYNELTVPYGKTFELGLSDGSTVYLNSGTVLKYPIRFLEGQNRQVYLTGEAYFKVAKDKNHPFIVHSNDLNIRVLGTEFNVSSYPEDKNIFTVLVEGSVGLYEENKGYKDETVRLLKPGRKARWNKDDKKIRIKPVDTSIYTSWIDGKLVIEKLNFIQIVKRLERKFNVKIKNNNKILRDQTFTATFQIETIEEVLESFKANFPFEYTINGKEITIN